MYAIGHFALGYITGKGTSKLTKTKLNLPLLLVASIIPDVDLILQTFNDRLFMHRGLTHSLVTITLLMIPLFVIYRKGAAPYYVALLSHILIGDLPTGGIEMLWPVSQRWFGSSTLPMASFPEVLAEIILFATVTLFMFKAGDLRELMEPKKADLFLIIPFGAVTGPLLEIQRSDVSLPLLLVPFSLFWAILFAYLFVRHLRSPRKTKV